MTAPGTRVAVVTGGTAGVGRAAVREFARVGYDVAVLARGEAGLRGAVADVEAAGRRALAIPTDVADATAVEAAAERVESELGPIDVWVNVAFAGVVGVLLGHLRGGVPADDRSHVLRAGLRHPVGIGPDAAAGPGVIVNVGSAMAYRAIPLQSAYCGAKHAIKGFSEAVMTELAAERSNVSCAWCSCRDSTPRSSPGTSTRCPDTHDRWHRCSSPSWRRGRSGSSPNTRGARSGSGSRRRTPSSVSASRRCSCAPTWPAPACRASRPTPICRATVSNVFEPSDAEEDRGAHGPFDDEAYATTRCHGRRCTAWRSSPCSRAPRWPLSRAYGCAGADRRRLGADDGHRPAPRAAFPTRALEPTGAWRRRVPG